MCEAFSRSLKPIPNIHIAAQISQHCPPGLDGEIMTYASDLFDPTPRVRNFNDISSDVMSFSGAPAFIYHVFDAQVETVRPVVYQERLATLAAMDLPKFCVKVPHVTMQSLSDLLAYEAKCIAEGYEGICFRDPNSPYKYGRSTLREGWLIKMKRFVTEEAMIIGVEEEMQNNNPQVLGTTGYAERSSHKANMVGKGRVGALICKLTSGAGPFNVGTGFSAQQRQNMWDCRFSLPGRLITIKHMPHGAKDLPRIPIFVGFRSTDDL